MHRVNDRLEVLGASLPPADQLNLSLGPVMKRNLSPIERQQPVPPEREPRTGYARGPSPIGIPLPVRWAVLLAMLCIGAGTVY